MTLFLAGCSGAGGETGLTEGTGSGSTATGDGPSSGGASTTPTGDEPPGTSTGTSTDEPTGGSPTGGTTTGSTGDATTGAAAGGCGQDPGFRGATTETLTIAGAERDYILVLPAGYEPDKAYPLVFAWHGRGSNAAQARLYFQVEEAAAGQAIFVYPNGLPLADMMNQTGWDLDPNNEDFAFFDAMLAAVEARLCVDRDRIFSTGHSFGGYMSNQLGCARGDVLRAIGEVAGGGPFSACTGQVAAWLAHGTLDEIVPYSQGEDSRDHWTAANNCEAQADPVDPAPCTAFAGCDDGHPVIWCSHDLAELAGHTWPSWAGAAIWGFFAAQ